MVVVVGDIPAESYSIWTPTKLVLAREKARAVQLADDFHEGSSSSYNPSDLIIRFKYDHAYDQGRWFIIHPA